MHTISIFGVEYLCKETYNGVSIYLDDEEMGIIPNLTLPDITDEAELIEFEQTLLIWLFINS